MRDKYNLNTLPPSLAGLEDYEMDEHIVIPGMGGMNEDRLDFGDQPLSLNEPPPTLINSQRNVTAEAAVNDVAAIPGLDLDLSALRDKKIPSNKPISNSFQDHLNVHGKGDEMYGITAHDPVSILKCVRELVGKMIQQLPGIIPLADLKPEKIQVYGKEIDVVRKLQN